MMNYVNTVIINHRCRNSLTPDNLVVYFFSILFDGYQEHISAH